MTTTMNTRASIEVDAESVLIDLHLLSQHLSIVIRREHVKSTNIFRVWLLLFPTIWIISSSSIGILHQKKDIKKKIKGSRYNYVFDRYPTKPTTKDTTHHLKLSMKKNKFLLIGTSRNLTYVLYHTDNERYISNPSRWWCWYSCCDNSNKFKQNWWCSGYWRRHWLASDSTWLLWIAITIQNISLHRHKYEG